MRHTDSKIVNAVGKWHSIDLLDKGFATDIHLFLTLRLMVKRGYTHQVFGTGPGILAAFNTFAAISTDLSLNCIPVPWRCGSGGLGRKGEYICGDREDTGPLSAVSSLNDLPAWQ